MPVRVTATKTPLAQATPQQRRLMEAWHRHGSLKAAAHELGISVRTARNHVDNLYERTGARHVGDVFYWLGVERAGLGKSPTDLGQIT